MNAAVAHRTREIGTLRALGFSRGAILVSFLFEAIVLAVIGGAIGSLLVQVLTLIEFHTMNFVTFSEIAISFRAAPSVFVSALLFSVIMGLVGGLIPAIRASRVSPVEAMRG
jgi:putative ABC transport system permease protein